MLNRQQQFVNLLRGKSELGICSSCGETMPFEDLDLLPEVKHHHLEMVQAMLDKKPIDPINDKKLIEKYGFDRNSLFCKKCLQEILEKSK